MTDLSALKGMVPKLAAVPAVVYFHENQFAYPPSSNQHGSLEPQIVNLYTALVADKILFNSDYNRTSFLDGVSNLLSRLPDYVPENVPRILQERSHVVPVPLPDNVFVAHEGSGRDPLNILWNHRWEYDKSPEVFFMALSKLKQSGIDFRVHVLGQQFRRMPDVFREARLELDDCIGRWGYVESTAEYRTLLAQSDVVVSTAIHDFQGIAILEGVAAGCQPLVPDRLAYRELFPHRFRYAGTPSRPEQEAVVLATRLQRLTEQKAQGFFIPDVPDVTRLRWSCLGAIYNEVLGPTLLR